MIEASASAGDPAANAAIERLRRALELQSQHLASVRSRVVELRSLMPAPSNRFWQGPAQLGYSIGLVLLGAELAAIEGHLDDAHRDTRRSIESLGNRVG